MKLGNEILKGDMITTHEKSCQVLGTINETCCIQGQNITSSTLTGDQGGL